MTVTVHIPLPLQRLTNNQATVEVADVTSIEELIDSLENDHAGIKDKLVGNGEIRGYINIFVNDEDIRFMKDEGVRLKDGDNVHIVPSIAGGI
ncbi:MAG: MoaD/ThiS family protein [Candidatus Poribacteria bacterium]|nr:MoaD/ThiS family protein [Candidatus Poribacteria bacterium]